MLVIVLLALVSFGGSVAAQSEATMERGLVHDLQAVFKQGRMLIFRLRSAVRALENQTDALDSVESTVKAALVSAIAGVEMSCPPTTFASSVVDDDFPDDLPHNETLPAMRQRADALFASLAKLDPEMQIGIFTGLCIGIVIWTGAIATVCRCLGRKRLADAKSLASSALDKAYIRALLASIDGLMSLLATRDFLADPVGLPKTEDLIKILSDPTDSNLRRHLLMQHVEFLRKLTDRVNAFEAQLTSFRGARSTLSLYLSTLDEAAHLQYHPRLTSHKARALKIADGLAHKFSTEEYYNLRENLEYLTGGATAATNSVALLDMEPHPHVSQGEAYEMQAVGQPILPENPVKWL